MARTTFSGPVASDNGFLGDITGDTFVSVATVAATGGNQDSAAALDWGFTLVTGADDSKGVILPDATTGGSVTVLNAEAANTFEVYPASGETINGGNADVAVTVGNAEASIFIAISDTAWRTITPATPT
jgi:hypothetical protein